MKRILLVLAVLSLMCSPAPAAEPPKKVLLIASGPDGHPPATHEYAAGLDILARLLKPAGVR